MHVSPLKHCKGALGKRACKEIDNHFDRQSVPLASPTRCALEKPFVPLVAVALEKMEKLGCSCTDVGKCLGGVDASVLLLLSRCNLYDLID